MLSTREAILAQQQRGDFTGEQRTQDPIHPNDLGHEILAQLVIQYFQLVKF
jgi:lysophospholipase L1-like esterase